MFYSVYERCVYNPWTRKKEFGITLPRLDWIRYRVAVTYGMARVPKTGLPLPAATDQYPISDQTTANWSIKSAQNYTLGNTSASTSALDYSVDGFDTTDTDWHHLSGNVGLITLAPIVIPLTVQAQSFNSEVMLYKPSVQWRLCANLTPPYAATVLTDVYTGSESNAPSGGIGPVGGTWTVSGTNTYVDVAVTGATSGTRLAIGNSASTGSPGDHGDPTQTPLAGGANTVRISFSTAPGTSNAWNGSWNLLAL